MLKGLALAMVVTVVTSAQQPASAPRIDIAALGPQVGARVPGFELRDQDGRTQTLDTIMGPKGAMLVFYRSADW